MNHGERGSIAAPTRMLVILAALLACTCSCTVQISGDVVRAHSEMVKVGDALTVHTREGKIVEGTLKEVREDSLVLAVEGDQSESVSKQDITFLERGPYLSFGKTMELVGLVALLMVAIAGLVLISIALAF